MLSSSGNTKEQQMLAVKLTINQHGIDMNSSISEFDGTIYTLFRFILPYISVN
ncbi:hypothetical protein Hjap01_03405 [Haloarcula japonica]